LENLSLEPSETPVEDHVARGPIDIGYVVAGRYELKRLLGHGSMGEVWAANHRGLGETVALKLLTHAPSACRLESQSRGTARFRFEARLAAHLSRKTRHVVRVSDYGEEGGLPYLVMELLEGQTLEARLVEGPLLPTEVAIVVGQIARALEEAHADGVVHRDLKPANVFLTRDEDGAFVAKLLDFGIARTVCSNSDAPPVTANGLWFGTPGYLSPEQARMQKLDTRCDLWALATVAYEALTGELPIAGAAADELIANLHARYFIPIHERMPQLPTTLAAFFERAFAERIDSRFATASELAAALEHAVCGDLVAEEDSATVALRAVQEQRPPRPGGWTSLARTVARRARDRRGLMVVTGMVVGLLTLAVARAARGPAGASSRASEAAMPDLAVMAEPRPALSDSAGSIGPGECMDVGVRAAARPTSATLPPPMRMANAAHEATAANSRQAQSPNVQGVTIAPEAPRRATSSSPPRPLPQGAPPSVVSNSAKASIDRSSFF